MAERYRFHSGSLRMEYNKTAIEVFYVYRVEDIHGCSRPSSY